MPAEPRAYGEEVQGPVERFELGELETQGGDTLADAFLGYRTHGELNEARDNAILVSNWFGGTHQLFEQAYVGEGHALDPERWFVVVVNGLGNGVSRSPHHGDPADFPDLTIADDVQAQARLLDELEIERLALVAGCSMGGQLALHWAATFPDRVARAAAIAATATTPPHAALLADQLAGTLRADPAFEDGAYEGPKAMRDALKRHGRLLALLGFGPAFWAQALYEPLGFSDAEGFLKGFVDAPFAQMDPNALLAQAGKWRRADVGTVADDDRAAALGRIEAPTLLAPIDHDLIFAVADVKAEAAEIGDARVQVLEAATGHLAIFGLDPAFVEQVDSALGELLDESA